MKNFKEKTLFYLFLFTRRFVYGVLFVFGQVFPLNRVVVLCYHSVGDDNWRFSVSLKALTRQMIYMVKHYEPVTIEDIARYVRGEITFKKPVFAVAFDDGYADIMQTTEMFHMYGIHPGVFVLSETGTVDREELGATRDFLTDEQIKQLHTLGWTIGSHGATHQDFFGLDASTLQEEIIHSKKSLEQRLGLDVRFFAYPKGRYTEQVLQTVSDAGYEAAFSMDDRLIKPGNDTRTIARIGVDNTHTEMEFEATVSIPAVLMRSLVKHFDKWNTLRKKDSTYEK